MALGSQSLHVLVIEDSPEDFGLIREYLREVKDNLYILHHCETLQEGKQFLHCHQINVVLLDLNLPDSNNLDTFQSLYQECRDVPIVVLTGMDEEAQSLGVHAIKLGAQDFLNKNELNHQILRRTIRYAIERNHMIWRLEKAQLLAKIGHWELDLATNEIRGSSQLWEILDLPFTNKPVPFKVYFERVHPDDQVAVATALDDVCKGKKNFMLDHRIVGAGHTLKQVNLQGTFKPSQAGAIVFGSTQDITERQRFETMERQKEMAEKAAQLRQDFLAKTSHEIRTPLNPILVLTNILLKTDLSPEQKEQIGIIQTAGETLLALVNDILDLSKIEAGKIIFAQQPFELFKVFESIEHMMEVNAKEKHLSLDFTMEDGLPEVVIGDPVRLTQILLNLVNNAIKFTNEGGIKIRAWNMERRGSQVKIGFEVTDTGMGIPRDKLKIIFESFQQLDSPATRQHGGTGLGLTIVRQLVRLQQGTIQVDSEVGKGSTFTFDLNFRVAGVKEKPLPLDAQIPHTRLTAEQLSGLTVLLVEDNPLNQLVTHKLLSKWGITTDIANNGRECLARLQEKWYDLVLMDVQMPEMDGYEATRMIRTTLPPPVCDIPIIALTANAFVGSADECIQAGMDDYLSKPIEINHLFDKLAVHVHRPPNPSVDLSNSDQQLPPKNGHHAALAMQAVASHNPYFQALPVSISNGRMSQTNYADLSVLRTTLGADSPTFQAAIRVYLEGTPEIMQTAADALADQDYEAFHQALHKLKSSMGFMGMEATVEHTKSMIHIARNEEDKSSLPAGFSVLQEHVNGSYNELRAALS